MNINISPSVTRAIGRASLIIQKHSPEILMGAGIVTGIAATVFACKATLKVNDVKCKTQAVFLDIANARYADEHHQLEEGKTYTEEDAKKDTVIAYFQGAWALARLYAPAIGLGVLSIGMILQSRRILSRRNAALMAAYNALSLTFDQYKEKVSNDFGVDPVAIVDELIAEEKVVDKKTGEVIEERPVYGKKALGTYVYIWDKNTSRNWKADRTYNEAFLKSTETFLNHRLQTHGHVFLNEALDELGLEHDDAGIMTGWLYNHKDAKDEYIRIGWNDERNSVDPLRDPNPPYVLEFNVDGMIYGKIG